MKPLITLRLNFCSDGVDRSVSSTFLLLGLGFESSKFFGCHHTTVFAARTGKNQMSRLPRKNEALGQGNNGFPFHLLLFG